LLPSIFTFIRDKVVPTIKDIRLVDEFQRFLVNDDGFEESMDLTSYGEGLQRVFFTALLFSSAKDGIVLIDEFENAIHADLVGKFASYIYTLSKEFNVQVFLTSHSKECIDAFVTTAGKTQPSDFTLHALLKERNDPVTVRGFSGAEYSKLLKAADVDLRRAR
jgi:predicted ATPase